MGSDVRVAQVERVRIEAETRVRRPVLPPGVRPGDIQSSPETGVPVLKPLRPAGSHSQPAPVSDLPPGVSAGKLEVSPVTGVPSVKRPWDRVRESAEGACQFSDRLREPVQKHAGRGCAFQVLTLTQLRNTLACPQRKFLVLRLSVVMLLSLLETTLAFAQAPEIPGWKLVWSDEFNRTGHPDPAKWGYGEGYIRRNELQYCRFNRLENARVGGGQRLIELRKEAPGSFLPTSINDEEVSS